MLEQVLRNLGVIGKRPQLEGKRYPIGNCAEQHAASIYMKQFGVNDLNELSFVRLCDLELKRFLIIAIIVKIYFLAYECRI